MGMDLTDSVMYRRLLCLSLCLSVHLLIIGKSIHRVVNQRRSTASRQLIVHHADNIAFSVHQ